MPTQHDSTARPPLPRPSLLATGAARGGRPAAAPPRFLDAVDAGRALPAARDRHRRPQPAWLVGGVALLAGAGAVLGMAWNARGWLEASAPAAAAPLARAGLAVTPQPATLEADTPARARGAARLERLERPDAAPVPLPAALAALGLAPVPPAGAADARPPAGGGDRHPVRLSVKRHGPEAGPAVAATPAGSARTASPAPADAVPPDVTEEARMNAEAELLEAVLAWDQRHPPAAARATRPPGAP